MFTRKCEKSKLCQKNVTGNTLYANCFLYKCGLAASLECNKDYKTRILTHKGRQKEKKTKQRQPD